MMVNDIAKLAHDMRTPLAALKVAVDLLALRQQSRSDTEAVRLVACLRQNVAHLEQIVNSMTAPAEVGLTERFAEESK